MKVGRYGGIIVTNNACESGGRFIIQCFERRKYIMDPNVKAILDKAKATAVIAAERAGKMADAATKKAGDMASITKLNLQIFELNSDIDGVYKEIGQIVYQAHIGNEGRTVELDDKFAQVDERMAKIAEVKETIAYTKTTVECPGCGRECSKEDAFCSKCGHKLA